MEEMNIVSIKFETLSNRYKHLHGYTSTAYVPILVVKYTLGDYEGERDLYMLNKFKKYKSPENLLKEFLKAIANENKERIKNKNIKEQEKEIIERFTELLSKADKKF